MFIEKVDEMHEEIGNCSRQKKTGMNQVLELK